ncbi:MAG TPA: glycosyltransferase [Candidatus Binatia bacterium]|jgi:glycosyltransferase involved in cell wall biosynthesis
MTADLTMDADTDRIDVVIPVRGNPAWLRLSLESIASQSVLPNAVWVVDDGLELKADAVDLGKRCLGQRFRLLKSAAQGISAALNTAIRQSSAEWIARMDSDDVAHPQRLQRQLEFLKAEAHGTIGCGTQVRFINGDGDVLDRSRLPTTWQDIVKQIHCTTSFIHPTLLIRRDALLATPYRSQMDGAEDVDLILRLAEKYKILNLDEALLDYRLDPTQESFRARPRQTALQELAFRLARTRRKTEMDPLAVKPELAETFVQWRLSDPAYVNTRYLLTALRYIKTYLRGKDLKNFTQLAAMSLKWLPTRSSSIRLAWRVARHAGAALLNQATPFNELN